MRLKVEDRHLLSPNMNRFMRLHGVNIVRDSQLAPLRGPLIWSPTRWGVAFDPTREYGCIIITVRGTDDDGSEYTCDVESDLDSMENYDIVAEELAVYTKGRFDVAGGVEEYTWEDIWHGTVGRPGMVNFLRLNITGECQPYE